MKLRYGVAIGVAHFVMAGRAAAQAIAPLASVASPLPHDLSPLGMFLAADPVVKAIIAGLLIASVATWTVGIAKAIELAIAKRALRSGLPPLHNQRFLAEAHQLLADRPGMLQRLVGQAIIEIGLSADLRNKTGAKDRIASRLQETQSEAARAMRSGTGLLATVGATAPFIGLFGTVWGVMNSFIGISQSHTTNLAVVAPGIAEALLATGVGLFAAIPAVVIYNGLSRSILAYRALLRGACAEVMGLASRDLDRLSEQGAMRPQAAEQSTGLMRWPAA